MPITVLHAGVLAPFKHWFPERISIWSFILVNLLIDANSILYALFNISHLLEPHGAPHTLPGMLMAAVFVAIFRFSYPWFYGAVFGAITRLILNGLVHPEMQPFAPLIEGNPLYMGWMEGLSVFLLPLTIWFIFQSVSGSLGWARKRWARRASLPTREPSS